MFMVQSIWSPRTLPRFRSALLFAIMSFAVWGSPSQGSTQVDYLGGKTLNFTLPSAPTDAAEVALELSYVRSSQPPVGSLASDEAIVDAKAYDADMLLGRFSDGALTPLIPAQRPMLMRLLGRALTEVGNYSGFYKNVAERPRPYAEDTSIKLCYDNPQFPLDAKRSYPSGHAANGYAAALMIAEVFPARRQQIIARGIRYGENRVVCGAHQPSDVFEGQLLAIEYFKEVSMVDRFQQDLGCARAENDVIDKKQQALPPSCTAPGA